MNSVLRSRIVAASVHFLVCAAVGGALWLLLDLVWYPDPLFRAVGGQEIFLILLGVDVVLGPAMTLVVYKSDKRKLKFDLTVIAIVQFAALAYGTHTLWLGRPVYLAALGHRFDVVQANEVSDNDADLAGQSLPIWGPIWVGTREAEDKRERERLLMSALGGRDYGSFPRYHIPLSSMRNEILKNAASIDELKRVNPTAHERIDEWLRVHGATPNSVVYQGLKARTTTMTVMLDKETARVVGIAPFNPWR